MSDDTNAADVLRDDELASTHGDPIRTAIEERLKDVHTAMFGIIRSFNPTKQTATVQPVIKRLWVDDGALDLPECQDVPVHFARGGKFVLTFPVSPGDECLLVFGERAFDNWLADGGTQEPSEYRMHDLSDACALVGFSSMPNVVANLATDATELRTLDGATVLRLENDTAYVGAKAGSEKAILGETYRQQEDLMLSALAAFANALVSACTGVVTLGQAAIAINAIGPAATPLANAIATFQSAASAYLARKAKVA